MIFNKQFAVFATIGVLNTALHAIVVFVIINYMVATQILANTIAFVIANIFSYFLNTYFTFKIAPSIVQYIKFFSASLISLLCTIAISTVAQIFNMHYMLTVLMVVTITPVFTFVLQKRFVFK